MSDSVWSKLNKEDDEDWMHDSNPILYTKDYEASFSPVIEDIVDTFVLRKRVSGRFESDPLEKMDNQKRMSNFD